MNMNGWDTVFVASVDAINASLSRSTVKLLQKFSFSEQGDSVSGVFGTWSVVAGGSGKLLMLQIQITSGTMLMAAGATPIDLSGMAALLLVNLQILPSPATPASQSLVFNFKQVGPVASSSSGVGVVTPHDILNSGNLTLVQKAALGSAVANVLVENAGQVSFVFATVNPTQASAVGWMHPVASRYAYLAPAGVPASLAILSVTSARDTSPLPLLMDPAILLGTGNAGLAVSPALFLQNVMGPALLASLKASGSMDVNGSGVLVNTSTLNLPEIHKAGESYHPQVDSMTATITDTQINVAMNGSCDMHMGVRMTFGATSNLSASLSTGGSSLQLATVGTPTFHKDVSIPWYDHMFDIVGVLPEIILQSCVAAISSELAGGISSSTSADAFVQSAPAIVSWANGGGFKVQTASLASSLCLRGVLS
jgi:hypothetical protein